jgi:hypothetical protein
MTAKNLGKKQRTTPSVDENFKIEDFSLAKRK